MIRFIVFIDYIVPSSFLIVILEVEPILVRLLRNSLMLLNQKIKYENILTR